MTCIRFLAMASSIVAVSFLTQPAMAGGSLGGGSFGGSGGGSSYGGSWGGSAGGSSGGGSYGGSWGGSSGGSWGGSSGRVGPLRRLAARIHARKVARRAARHSYGGSVGGSSGGYAVASSGSWGGSSGGSATISRGSHGGSSGGSAAYAAPVHSSGVSSYSHPVVSSVSLGAAAPYETANVSSNYDAGGSIIDGTVVSGTHSGSFPIEGTVIEGSAVPIDGTVQGESILDATTQESQETGNSETYESAKPAVEDDAAMLTVTVPEDAVVTVNEHRTSSDGSVRQFKSEGLKTGYVYTYVVKATYDVEGSPQSKVQEVKLRAGESKSLSFESSAESEDTAENENPVDADDTVSNETGDDEFVTVVRLHVPSEAQVTLAGNATNGRGAVRTFRTKQLKPGQQWKDYTVEVVATVNGQSVTRQQTIDVSAGDTHELTFSFGDVDSVAVR